MPPGFELRRLNRGFTLIEFIVALVVLGLGSALLVSFITPAARSADPMIQAQARAIAAAYMDEILLRSVDGDCTGTRGEWAGIQCYAGLNETPRDQFGNAIPALADYRVAVSVSGAPALIRVEVSHASGRGGFALQGARGSY